MRVCWNWQTGMFEGHVCLARMGSSPITRTSVLLEAKRINL